MLTNPVYVNRRQAKRIAKSITVRYGQRRRRAGVVMMAAATGVPSNKARLALVATGAVTYASGKRAQLKARKLAHGYVKQGKHGVQVTTTMTAQTTKFGKRRVRKQTTANYQVIVNGRQARKQQFAMFPLKRSTVNQRVNHVRRDLSKKSTYSKMTRSQSARKAALARWGK